MKKYLIILFFFFYYSLFIDNYSFSQWIPCNDIPGLGVYGLDAVGNTIYCAVYGNDGGIYSSTNNGLNWVFISYNQVSSFTFCIVHNENYLFAGGAGVKRSSNGGTNWVSVNVGLPSKTVRTLLVKDSFIFAGLSDSGGVYRSSNNGDNWISSSLGLNVQFIYTICICGPYIFAGTSNGIFRTSNSGLNWENASAGIVTTGTWSIASSGTILYSGSTLGIHKSTNYGNNWSFLTFFSLATQSLTAIGNNVLDGSKYDFWVSSNNGSNWINKNQSLTSDLQSLIVFIYNKTVYFGTSGTARLWRRPLPELIPTYNISGTVRYTDNNQPVTSGVVKAIKLNQNDASIIVLDTAIIQTNGTYTLPNVPQDSCYIGLYPNSGSTPDYVISYYPTTTDWQHATVLYPTGNLTNINLGAIRMTTTTAGNSVNGKVMRLTDIVTGNLKDAVLYAKNGNTYVRCSVSDVNGVYHLQSLPTGNLKIIVNRLGFTGDSTNVNVTSTSNIDSVNFHLYRFPVGIKQISIEVPTEFKLFQNFPNPFNPSTKIKFSLPLWRGEGGREISLKIYEITGREIATLVNEQLTPGTYEVTFDGSNLSSGIYFYQLLTKNFSSTKKMLIIK